MSQTIKISYTVTYEATADVIGFQPDGTPVIDRSTIETIGEHIYDCTTPSFGDGDETQPYMESDFLGPDELAELTNPE